MKRYVINGKFMADRMQGIVRYGRELCIELDNLIGKDIEVVMLLPHNAHNVPEYKNIKTEIIGQLTGIVWEQVVLGRWLRRHREYTCINFCNVAPLFVQPGISVIHDVMYKAHPEFYTSLRNKISRCWHVIQYAYLTKHEKVIVTVSEFSKCELEKYYPVSVGKVAIVPCAWQHVLRFDEGEDWRQRYPELKPNEYYFSMATLAKNKNGKWVIDAARLNPSEKFAIAGEKYEMDYFDIPENIQFLGFISDDDARSLIENCKAFLFPSLYEGFGLPPLEALAFGAKVIVSKEASLPEVMGDSAVYIDPSKPLNRPIASIHDFDLEPKALDRFSWEKSGVILSDILRGE